MEAKLNIANILKDKPSGTKLYADAFGELSFEGISIGIIYTRTKAGTLYAFYKNGKCSEYGEPILVPSKEMRNWRKFSWKKGDVLISNDYGTEVIFDKWYDNTYTNFHCKHYLNSEDKNKILYYKESLCATARYSLEDRNAAQTYINTIEERLGGKLNRETLEIEKQQEFKDGDIITITTKVGNILTFIFRAEDVEKYYCHAFLYGKIVIANDNSFCKKDFYIARQSTEEEKKQLFEALAKEGKTWDAVKKQIVDLKPKWTPKPFDRVITRTPETPWTANFFSHIDSDGIKNCIDDRYIMCLPYNDETAKLIGTTNNWRG